ncbi:MAG TPA: response regulator transcription factor [Candidatus Elarobacter sp.]|nr:response regulator transcription factor [Candidatus Elarobacter sp.]
MVLASIVTRDLRNGGNSDAAASIFAPAGPQRKRRFRANAVWRERTTGEGAASAAKMEEPRVISLGGPPMQPRIAAIDDEEGMRHLLEVGLSVEGFEVRTAVDGVEGLKLIREWQPDAVVLDVMLPKVDGFTLIGMIRRITEVPILVLTARGEVRDRIEGLRAGADDYVPKPFDTQELAMRLRAALRRPALREVDHVTFEDLEIDVEARTVRREMTYIRLSAREFDLLLTLARRPRRVFTRDELIDLVWGNERDTSTQTVETFISSLRQKVDAPFTRPLIHTVRGVGYTLRSP